jgi:hypothetical protein
MNTKMNFGVPKNTGNFLTEDPKRIVVHGVIVTGIVSLTGRSMMVIASVIFQRIYIFIK